jgi:hypothetical protein
LKIKSQLSLYFFVVDFDCNLSPVTSFVLAIIIFIPFDHFIIFILELVSIQTLAPHGNGLSGE